VNIFNNYVDRIAQATPSFVLMMSVSQSIILHSPQHQDNFEHIGYQLCVW